MLKRNSSASKFLCAFLAALICVLALSSCQKVEKNRPQTEVVAFTDALGREVTVSKNVKRVAALIGSFADVWLLAGGTVCATAEDAWDDFGLDLPGAVSIGGAHSPGLELILSADPDLVIASASTASNVELKDALEGAGITVAYFDVDNFEDYLSMLDICTDITGRKDLYEKNGIDVQKRIETVKNEIKSADLSEDQRKILLLRASSGSVKAKGSEGTILGEMLYDLGFLNIADSDNSLLENLSVESVIKAEPYRIFVVTMGDDTKTAIKNLERMMEDNPAWGTLAAVENKRLYVMDRKMFNIKPNAKWANSYEKLGEILLNKQ